MTKQELATEIEKGLGAMELEHPLPIRPAELYLEWLEEVPGLTEPRCIIYAGLWCTYSHLLVANFLNKAQEHGKNMSSLRELYELFRDQFVFEIFKDEQKEMFAKRARIILDYVGDLDLSEYGVPEYDKAEEWI